MAEPSSEFQHGSQHSSEEKPAKTDVFVEATIEHSDTAVTSEEVQVKQPTTVQAERSAPTVEYKDRHTGLSASSYISSVYQNGSKWDQATKRMVLVILFITLVFLVWISRPILPLLIVSGIIAYFLSPIVDLCERLHIPRGVSTIILFLLLLVGLILTPILVVPILIEQLIALNFDVSSTAFTLLAWLNSYLNNVPEHIVVLGFDVPVGEIVSQAQSNYLQTSFIPTLTEILGYIQQGISTATTLVSSTAAISISVVGRIFQGFLSTILIFMLSLYLTKDTPNIRSYIEGLFPYNYYSEWVDVMLRIARVWRSFFRGQITLSLVIGAVTWVILTLLGMPGALILAIWAGVMEVIPNIGPVLAMIPAVFVALIQGSTVLSEYGVDNLGFALIIVGIYFVIQQLENSILVPRIIGDSVNLHPVIVLCGVIVGFSVAAVWGAFLAAPVIASLRVLGSYIHAKLLDYPPFLGQEMPRRRNIGLYRRTVTGEALAAQRKEKRPVKKEQRVKGEGFVMRTE